MRLPHLILVAPLLVTCAASALLPATAAAQVIITVGVPPPPLPVYVQPPISEPGYLWAPGYWDYDDDFGYYWVPGI